MRSLIIGGLALSFIGGCYAQTDPAPEAITSETIAADDPDWRDISPENLILIETIYGDIAIELNSDFAPNQANQFRPLVRDDV